MCPVVGREDVRSESSDTTFQGLLVLAETVVDENRFIQDKLGGELGSFSTFPTRSCYECASDLWNSDSSESRWQVTAVQPRVSRQGEFESILSDVSIVGRIP